MAALSNALVISEPRSLLRSSSDQLLQTTNLIGLKSTRKPSIQKRALTIQASYSDRGGPSSASMFIGGFVLGGVIVGTLGCIYAPQISYALAGTDKKDLMKKLPKFIYDEEKALEKQRKKLSEKIEQLNLAIDGMSNQLPSEEPPIETAASEDNEIVA
ncbi:uncharacterized protein LOC127247019 isoform X2 [Andrographis paniculata]|uniref:uncharacterized protein LOC127247019 isoform X2 n=1 Tax=Andrographis paniculata TaxID=175694 RepID=UPI0021E82B54|nr:uncharacterized protein LOC127247019 isoform X2 [Andrographis paniculata]